MDKIKGKIKGSALDIGQNRRWGLIRCQVYTLDKNEMEISKICHCVTSVDLTPIVPPSRPRPLSMHNYFRLLIMVLIVSCLYGCASLLRYPPVEKELFSWQIPKNEVETIKNTIRSSGYKVTTKDNYNSCVNYSSFTDCVIISQYGKEILTPTINSKVHIRVTFKETDPPSDFYRNLGITISNLDRNDIPEINAEINRIEEILYKKLLEVAGGKNVVRERSKGVRER